MYSIFEQLLQAAGISTAEFCAKSGISQSTISNWKKRGNLISGENAKIIADFFDVSIDYLYTGMEKQDLRDYSSEAIKSIEEFSRKTSESFRNTVLQLNTDSMNRLALYAKKLADLQAFEIDPKIIDAARQLNIKNGEIADALVAQSKKSITSKE